MFVTSEDLDALKQGSVRVQNQFWKAYWNEIFAICRHVLGDCPDATEVAVDILSDFLLKYVHNLKTPNAVRVYLRLMATRRSLAYKDKKEKFVALECDSLSDDARPRPDEDAEIYLLTPRLYECMEMLTPKAQKVLGLRYKKQLANEKIGEMVGGSRQYIGRLITRSIELLKNCLQSSVSQQGEIET